MSLVESPSQTSSDYSALLHQVRAMGLLRPRTRYYLLLAAANLVALGLVVTGLVLTRDSWWALLLAPALALVSAQTTFFAHDAAHRQVTSRRRARVALCLVHGNLLNGLSYGWWVAKHNAHHAHPNDLHTDPDVAAGAFVFDSTQAAGRSGVTGWMTRHQAGMFFPLLTLEALNLHVASVRALLRPGIRHRRTEGLLLVAHAVLYVGLLASTMTWAQGLVFFAIHQALYGVYLGCSFAPSHKGMPTLTAAQRRDPLLRQVLASRNVKGGRVVDLALGGLNLQIEHHLFPSMPRPNLRLAQPVVRRHCLMRGIPYAESSLLDTYRAALHHLHEVGEPLRPRHRSSPVRGLNRL